MTGTGTRRPGGGDTDGFCRLLDRLSSLLERETAALREGHWDQLDAFNRAKNRAVLELRRQPRPHAGQIDEQLAADLDRLRRALEDNAGTLQLHIDAAVQVSEMIVEIAAEQESDGTYSRSAAVASGA